MITTFTTTSTFTRTHAVYLASKVAADLRQMQRFYGQPSDEKIQNYIEEIILLMLDGYLDSVEYGFQRNGNWIGGAALSYSARWGSIFADDSPGRVLAMADIAEAAWCSFLTKSQKFNDLSHYEKIRITEALPIQRTDGVQPSAEGNWHYDKTYSSGGGAIQRRILKPI